MGKKGLSEAAELSYDKAHYLAKRLCEIPGIKWCMMVHTSTSS